MLRVCRDSFVSTEVTVVPADECAAEILMQHIWSSVLYHTSLSSLVLKPLALALKPMFCGKALRSVIQGSSSSLWFDILKKPREKALHSYGSVQCQ